METKQCSVPCNLLIPKCEAKQAEPSAETKEAQQTNEDLDKTTIGSDEHYKAIHETDRAIVTADKLRDTLLRQGLGFIILFFDGELIS